MKTIYLSLCVATLAGIALNRPAMALGPPAPDVMTCWYNENEVLTGSSPAPEGSAAGVKAQHAGSGEHAWSYTVAGRDGSACPAKLPISTVTHE